MQKVFPYDLPASQSTSVTGGWTDRQTATMPIALPSTVG